MTVVRRSTVAEKESSMRRKQVAITGTASVLLGSLVLSACGATGEAGSGDSDEESPVTLRLATTQVEDAPENAALWDFVEIVENEAPWVDFQYVGGPETVEPTDAAESVQTGAFDIASVCTCYYTQVVPEAGALDLAPTSPSEDRENGALDMMNEWHQENGLYVLGGSIDQMSYFMHFGEDYQNLDIENLDLDGWLMRSAQTAQPAVEALGAEVVNLPISEVYTAMDRGTIDGFAAGNVGMYELGIAEPIEASLDVDLVWVRYPILFNQDRWNEMSPGTQEVLQNAMIEVEGDLGDTFGELIAEEHERWEEDGKELLTPSESSAETIASEARDGMWEVILDAAPRAQELRDLYSNIDQ